MPVLVQVVQVMPVLLMPMLLLVAAAISCWICTCRPALPSECVQEEREEREIEGNGERGQERVPESLRCEAARAAHV